MKQVQPLADDESNEEISDEVELVDAIAGIQRGLESMRAGRGKPANQVYEEIRAEFGFSDEHLK